VAIAEGLERAAAYQAAPLRLATKRRRVEVKSMRRKAKKGAA
jgi:hypothetical protein